MLNAIRSFFRYRGERVITCPETGKGEAVRMRASHAAWTHLTGSKPDLRLDSCTRWPERQDCAQACLSQISASPEGCRVRSILHFWYAGKECVFCHKPFGPINWIDHRPALLSPSRTTYEWSDIAPRELPEVLATHKPVCWNCHIAETFRREHPELVTDRNWQH